MAKSTQQKQQEALQRKRVALHNKRQVYLDSQYGCQGYEDNLKRFGEKNAQRIAEQNKTNYLRACAEAKVDEHGNPLENNQPKPVRFVTHSRETRQAIHQFLKDTEGF